MVIEYKNSDKESEYDFLGNKKKKPIHKTNAVTGEKTVLPQSDVDGRTPHPAMQTAAAEDIQLPDIGSKFGNTAELEAKELIPENERRYGDLTTQKKEGESVENIVEDLRFDNWEAKEAAKRVNHEWAGVQFKSSRDNTGNVAENALRNFGYTDQQIAKELSRDGRDNSIAADINITGMTAPPPPTEDKKQEDKKQQTLKNPYMIEPGMGMTMGPKPPTWATDDDSSA